MKILLLGASGEVGSRTAGELARADAIELLVLAARRDSKIGHLAHVLGGADSRVRSMTLDVRDPDALRAAAEGMDVVVSCAGPSHLLEYECAAAALRSGAHYVSLCTDRGAAERIRDLDDEARRRGVALVSGCGLSPGITNMLAALTTRGLDEVEEIEVGVALPAGVTAGPAAASDLLAAFGTDAPQQADHAPAAVPAGSGPKLTFFPDPVGWVETFICGHPEVAALRRTHPEVSSLRFRLGLTNKPAMDLLRALAASGVLDSEEGRRSAARLTIPAGSLLRRFGGPSWSAARITAWGRSEARRSSASFAVADHLVNLASMPMAHAARVLSEGAAPPGVHTAGDAFDPPAFLRALARRGIRVARLEAHPV